MSTPVTFRQLLRPTDPQFALVVTHQYAWWGEEFSLSQDQVKLYMRHSLCAERVPYTYLLEKNDQLIGFYQVVPNDLFTRPDLGPWFGFAYILPEHRGHGHFRTLMEAVPDHARAKGLTKLYLHSRHQGLYEKFGWRLIEESTQYKPDGILRRLYEYDLT